MHALAVAGRGLAEPSDFTLWSVERPRKGLEQTDDVTEVPTGTIVLEALWRMRGRDRGDGPSWKWNGMARARGAETDAVERRAGRPPPPGSCRPPRCPRSQRFPNS